MEGMASEMPSAQSPPVAAGAAGGSPPGQRGGDTAADMARRLLAQRSAHCCSCELAGVRRPAAGRVTPSETPPAPEPRGPESLAPESGADGGPRAGPGGPSAGHSARRTAPRPDEDRDTSSTESADTFDEKLPYHVHIVDRCPNGDSIVTFVPEPETDAKRHLLCLPVVVSRCWGPGRYPAEKPARCVAKAMVSMVTLLLFAVVCFLAGYFAVDLQDNESASPQRQGPVRVVLESSIRRQFLPSYNDPLSDSYRQLAHSFSKAIDDVFAKSVLHAEYSHCTVDSLRRGSVIVEYTVHLHSVPPTRHSEEGAPNDWEKSTRADVEQILREAVESRPLLDLKVVRESVRVTKVLFGAVDSPSSVTPTPWPAEATVLKVEPGLVNQRGCGTRPYDWPALDRIVGGTDSKPGRWPWLGSMRYWLGDGYGHRCAASLLNPEWAITAAHCVDGGVGDILDHIVFGDHELDGESPSRQRVGVERVAVHPGFSISRHDNDLALLKLSSRVRFDAHVSPVCLETGSHEVQRYRDCYIAGWGHTAESGNISELLQEAPIPLVSQEVCFQQLRDQVSETYSVITDNMICAGRTLGGVDSCQSDSGGPLMCLGEDNAWRVVGLTSFGYGCGRPELSGVYTRVSRYWDYISSTIRGEPRVQCQELTEPTCSAHLPYSKVFPNSQGNLGFFLSFLPNASHQHENETTTADVNASSLVPHTSLASRELAETLICLTVMPSCEETGAPPVVPCLDFCRGAVDYTFSLLARCDRYPVGGTSDAVFCTQGKNEDCGPTQLHPVPGNHSVIDSPHLPGTFVERSVGCTWTVTAPPGTATLFKFTVFKLPSTGRGKAVIIGTGDDTKNRSSRLYKLFGPPAPRPLLVPSHRAWLSYASMSELFDDAPEEFHFVVEVHAVVPGQGGFSKDACLNCLGACDQPGPCFPSWWRCDGLADCADGHDELSCPTHPPVNTTNSRPTSPPG